MSVRFRDDYRSSYEHHSAATRRPLFITGAWRVARSRCLWTFSHRATSRGQLSPGLRRTTVVDDGQGARPILLVPASSHYRRGPGQPLSSSLARRVRVHPLLLFLLLFVCRVRGHDLLELCNGPWLLSWSRGEMTERMLFPSVPSEETVCCLTVSLCLIIFPLFSVL